MPVTRNELNIIVTKVLSKAQETDSGFYLYTEERRKLMDDLMEDVGVKEEDDVE